MVDITRERRLSMTEAAEVAGVVRQTVYGWANGRTGRKLETAKLGGKRITSLEALQRFLSQSESDPQPQTPSVMDRLRAEAHAETLRQLEERHGI